MSSLGSLDKLDYLKSMEQTKENHLLNLNTAHSKLQSEMEKIQTWKLTVDAENKQKVQFYFYFYIVKIIQSLITTSIYISINVSKDFLKKSPMLHTVYILVT